MLAIRKSLPRLVEAVNTYKTNVCLVNTYVNNVLSSSLPSITPVPTDWQQYVSLWEQASSGALTWVNQCMSRLLGVPQDVITYDTAITALLQDAITHTKALISNPSNQAALAALNNDLTVLPQQLGTVETFITNSLQALQNFTDVLPTLATQLQTLSNLAIADNNADQQQIQTLQTQIQQLQDDINSQTTNIIGLSIADAAALTLGIVSSIVAFPVGLVAWFVMGPAVAVATTFIALDAIQIENDKSAIDDAQGLMSQLTAACSVLATMSTTYSNLAAQSQTIQTALQNVLTEWRVLSGDTRNAVFDIETAIHDEKGANYQSVLSDLDAAVVEWEAANTQAISLVLTLNVNNASLQVGMSQSAVQQTLASGTTVDLITYFNGLRT